jgi:hypothetical protein
MDGKLVIHNYGHGGCGLGFSWGTSQLALEEARVLAAIYREVLSSSRGGHIGVLKI